MNFQEYYTQEVDEYNFLRIICKAIEAIEKNETTFYVWDFTNIKFVLPNNTNKKWKEVEGYRTIEFHGLENKVQILNDNKVDYERTIFDIMIDFMKEVLSYNVPIDKNSDLLVIIEKKKKIFRQEIKNLLRGYLDPNSIINFKFFSIKIKEYYSKSKKEHDSEEEKKRSKEEKNKNKEIQKNNEGEEKKYEEVKNEEENNEEEKIEEQKKRDAQNGCNYCGIYNFSPMHYFLSCRCLFHNNCLEKYIVDLIQSKSFQIDPPSMKRPCADKDKYSLAKNLELAENLKIAVDLDLASKSGNKELQFTKNLQKVTDYYFINPNIPKKCKVCPEDHVLFDNVTRLPITCNSLCTYCENKAHSNNQCQEFIKGFRGS